MHNLIELEEKVKSGIYCHRELLCEECPYRDIDEYATHENCCVVQLQFDALMVIEGYARLLDAVDHSIESELF